jgi:hypothetical protein
MAIYSVYWLHKPNQNDIFKDGYVGVTPNFAKRLREHKHKFKAIWDNLIVEKIVVSTKEYCYDLEKQLRPLKNIGLNKAIGGYRNNTMLGKENPNFEQYGENAPNFQGWYITPKGKFATSKEAAKSHGLEQSAIIRKCKGRQTINKFYPPKDGWSFEMKGRVAS